MCMYRRTQPFKVIDIYFKVGAFSHKEMVEPIAVAVSPRGEFVVVDNGVGILVFDQCGKLIRNCHKS